MAVNNNNEINKMFGTEDEPILPPPDPELKTSPLGDASTPGASPFQDDSMKIPPHIDFSESGGGDSSGHDAKIGDHSSFGFSKYHSPRANLKIMLILVPLVLAIGVGIGIFATRNYFFGFEISAEHSAAEDAMREIYDYITKSTTPLEKVIFNDSFVNNKKGECEIVVFTVIEESLANFRAAAFRVVVDKNTNTTDVFPEFNQEEYDRLMNSENESDRIQAQILRNLSDEFERCLAEIQSGKWVNVDPAYINVRINK
ncbi:MAG: hypothetical protein FWG33_00220 [Oscillospiraceae bacterium]|nr:hypothetical protein [Oscillospiraceae bacterium]